jgi:ubiquinol-cytochrome c reductase cytochrome b subunit
LVTPAHIVPEWYFLPFYAILRCVPHKLSGVILMLFSIIILILMPFYIHSQIRSSQFRPLAKILFWLFLNNCLLLGWLGGNPAETPYVEIAQFCTVFYFSYFIFCYL